MIRIERVTHRYAVPGGEPVEALHEVSFSLEKGVFGALRGPSGCGKTTLLLIAGGLLRPQEGEVEVAGIQPYTLPPAERASFRANQVGFVFQQFHLVPYLDVLENVLSPGLASGRKDRRRALGLVRDFGLESRRHHKPAALSTGERQRTALARALYNGPRVLLADEPTGNLDPENTGIVLERLQAFAAEGCSVLMVSHDERATAAAHRVLELKAGRLLT